MKKIAVFSTLATDRFISVDKKILRESVGGPALFIRRTLDKLAVPYSINLADDVLVEIILTNEGEFGTILQSPSYKKIPAEIAAKAVLVSTLLAEWQLTPSNLPIFLDIQGYVRNYRQLKKDNYVTFPSEIEQFLYAFKGTEEEISQLEPELVERLKQKQLIITRGEAGATLFASGQECSIETKPIKNLPDTVGAGDTWFSAYMAYQVSFDLNPVAAAIMATDITVEFLEEKVQLVQKGKKYE